ncbi:hypothetical protein [Methylocystis parvus]|uniref:hypothetical protein n=1 Tax=Methylocystis parvus TaxID=134 RepID=UPI003C75784B
MGAIQAGGLRYAGALTVCLGSREETISIEVEREFLVAGDAGRELSHKRTVSTTFSQHDLPCSHA